MDDKLKVVAISGSLRQDSYNKKALRIVARFATEEGMNIEEIDLKRLVLPIYDADIESLGFPVSVENIRKIVQSSDVILIASPEYNHSVTGALKNAIDWLSTKINILDGKTAVIFGASTGPFGTLRSQMHLRQILAALNVFVLPQPQVYIRFAKEAFDDDDNLVDTKLQNQLKELIVKSFGLARLTRSLITK
jgi:chromate reductase